MKDGHANLRLQADNHNLATIIIGEGYQEHILVVMQKERSCDFVFKASPISSFAVGDIVGDINVNNIKVIGTNEGSTERFMGRQASLNLWGQFF